MRTKENNSTHPGQINIRELNKNNTEKARENLDTLGNL